MSPIQSLRLRFVCTSRDRATENSNSPTVHPLVPNDLVLCVRAFAGSGKALRKLDARGRDSGLQIAGSPLMSGTSRWWRYWTLRRVGFLAAPSLAVLAAIVATTGPLWAHRHDRKAHDASQAISGRHAAIGRRSVAAVAAYVWAVGHAGKP
jgi:hypothetical protein